MIFFESFGFLIMSLVLLKFTRLQQKLAMLYRLIEKPLAYILQLFILLSFIYALLSYFTLQLYGPTLYEFRLLTRSFYTMFTLFSLHSDQIYEFIHPLYRFNEWWTFALLIVYLVFMQYSFMNVITAVFFEEHRIASLYEDALKQKVMNRRREWWLKAWIKSGFRCLVVCKSRRKEEM